MTHDELLALINDEIEVCEPECNKHRWANAPWLALRTVVELHEPFGPLCYACTCNEDEHTVVWPCQTIRAIQGRLQ